LLIWQGLQGFLDLYFQSHPSAQIVSNQALGRIDIPWTWTLCHPYNVSVPIDEKGRRGASDLIFLGSFVIAV